MNIEEIVYEIIRIDKRDEFESILSSTINLPENKFRSMQDIYNQAYDLTLEHLKNNK